MRRLLGAGFLLLSLTTTSAAQAPPGTPAKTGQASFSLDGTPITYGQVSGTFNESYGFHTIYLVFSKEGKAGADNLTVSAMVQKAGALDLNQPMGNGIGVRKANKLYQYEKGKSQCTVTLTSVTATSIEGTADCPVINELDGDQTLSLKAVKFSASTK